MFKNSIAYSSFSVPDLAVTKEFYHTILGLEVKEIAEGLEIYLMGGAHVFVYPSKYYTAPECTILNFMVDDIDATVDALNKKGVTMEQYDLPEMKTDQKGIVRGGYGPKAIAWFKDPAGHILSVIQEK